MDIKKIVIFVISFLFLTFIILNYTDVKLKGIGWKDSWQEIQHERKQRVLDTCSKYPELQRQKIESWNFFYAPEYALLYCSMGKCGSTTMFLTTFRQILVGEEYTDYAKGSKEKDQARDETGTIFHNVSLAMENLYEKDTTSFVIVRHPFERIVSAFRWVEDVKDLSFQEYLSLIIKESEQCKDTKLCINIHWRPFSTCSPCMINYSVISKFESFEEDRSGLHSMIGLPYKGKEHYHDEKTLSESAMSTADWTKQFFSNVTLETKQKLREIYKYDFELYDYDQFLY